MSEEFISAPDLSVIREARLKAELAMKDVELLQLRCFVRYGLREGDTFDIATGRITRAEADIAADIAAVPAKP